MTVVSLAVYEHESLIVDGVRFKQHQLEALQTFYGQKGVPYFSLINKGVRFNEFVGVLQVGNMLIEVLPKADRIGNQQDWRAMLISMLRSVGQFDVDAPSASNLGLKPNSILDLYLDLFIKEIESLLHKGLVKKYRKREVNANSLKGGIHFSKNIKYNIVHKERFYITQTVYDVIHLLHQVMYKALKLVCNISKEPRLISKAATLAIWFPEMDDVIPTSAVFDRILLDRKTEPYRRALEIARLLLLNYHPDVTRGQNHVLALMFDMNLLWERFVFNSLRKQLLISDPSVTITSQVSKNFWGAETGVSTGIRPDILINQGRSDCAVIDTKWKLIENSRPSDNDLKQMYVYHEYFEANKVSLVFPGDFARVKGSYFTTNGEKGNQECSVIGLGIRKDIRAWEVEIGRSLISWLQGR